MAKIATKTVFTIGLLTMLMAVPAFGASINKSIRVDDGEESGGATTVNGSITVRNGAGSFELATVNGAVELYADRLDLDDRIEMESVNGALDLYLSSSAGADVRAESVNGKLSNDFGIEVHRGK